MSPIAFNASASPHRIAFGGFNSARNDAEDTSGANNNAVMADHQRSANQMTESEKRVKALKKEGRDKRLAQGKGDFGDKLSQGMDGLKASIRKNIFRQK